MGYQDPFFVFCATVAGAGFLGCLWAIVARIHF